MTASDSNSGTTSGTTANNEVNENQLYIRKMIDTTISIGIVFILISGCYLIMHPFILPVIWAIVIAVGLFPAFLKLKTWLGNSEKLSATTIVLLSLSLIIAPAIMMSSSIVDSVQYISTGLEQESLAVPPPSEKVKEWPVIGEQTYQFWLSASENLEAVLKQFAPEIKSFSSGLLSALAGIGGGILQFIFSIFIAAAFMLNADKCNSALVKTATRIMGSRGPSTIEMSGKTILSVAQGVLGVALIQAILAGIGLVIAGIPGAGLWALIVLLAAVMQLPVLIILGPIAAYGFTVMGTLPASVFLIWCVVVSISDAILKPMFLGRGVDVPMLVILLGAIGGMLAAGIIGLFIGAIVLAISYQLFVAWIDQAETQEA
ncbi:MAG: AI-2E family transporter [Gammaproteobacteria bacterium]|nr:MAG: AI-2E family transporter [Gammaproteobacteria bacterium]